MEWRWKMNKSIIFKVLFILLLLGCSWNLVVYAKNKEPEIKEVLFVYDDNTLYKESIINLINACGKSVFAIDKGAYYKGLETQYKYVILTSYQVFETMKISKIPILCIGEEFSKSHDIQLEKETFTKAEISMNGISGSTSFLDEIYVIADSGEEIYGDLSLDFNRKYPFGMKKEGIHYVPYINPEDISFIALGNVLKAFLGEDNLGSLYVVIDKVYAFSDFDILCKLSDQFYTNAIPFIITIMPVYEHYDYPSFKRFAQTLRYVQSRNGTIILHEPVERDRVEIDSLADKRTIEEKVENFKAALEKENIYFTEYKNKPYGFSYKYLEQISCSTKNYPLLPFNSAIVYELPKEEEEIEVMVKQINTQWFTLSDYKKTETTESFQYNEGPYIAPEKIHVAEETKFKEFFHAGNYLLYVVVSISILVFISIILISRHLYNKKFYK